ncbi:MAG: hypothetical protein LM517_00910 [Nitrosomonas sp.]|nr:hypothetical protein [Nitrosomonas sp.]
MIHLSRRAEGIWESAYKLFASSEIMKIIKFILLVFVIALAIDYFGRSPLIKEVAELKKPIGFEVVNIDSIVQKYILPGSCKEQVVNRLKSYGFEVLEESPVPGFYFMDILKDKCDQCSDIVVGVYIFKFLYILPAYKISIDIGFQDDHAIFISGGYVQSLP